MKDINLNERYLEKVIGGLELTISEPELLRIGNLAPPSEGDLKLREENMDRMRAGLKPSYIGTKILPSPNNEIIL